MDIVSSRAGISASLERVLVIKLGAFGDVVQADGALRDIRAYHRTAEITVLTTPPFRKLLDRCPHVDRVLTDPRPSIWKPGEWLSLARQLRGGRYARVYDLQKQDRTRLYRKLFFRKVPWVGGPRASLAPSALAGFATQLETAGVPVHHCLVPDVSWMADDMQRLLDTENVRKPYIVLIPGCSARHPQKRWPYYAQLATELIRLGYEIVTAPGPDEIELVKSIPGHALLGPNGFLNWFELAGVIRDACFVVGNDTGPSHVASCLGKPGLALFGPHTSAARTGICRGEFRAIEVTDLAALSVATVLEAVVPRLPSVQENSV